MESSSNARPNTAAVHIVDMELSRFGTMSKCDGTQAWVEIMSYRTRLIIDVQRGEELHIRLGKFFRQVSISKCTWACKLLTHR